MLFPGRFREHILPERTHMLNVSFQVQELQQRRGGTAANICYTMALLGEHPLLCAGVGRADFGAYSRALEGVGVDTSAALRCDDIGTATCYITTDLDDNQITAFFPGAMSRASAVDLTTLPDVSDVVVAADDPEAMARHIADTAALGARLTFAPAQQIPSMTDEVLRAGIDAAALVVGNDYEIEMISKRTGIALDGARGRSTFAVTHGSAGSQLYTSDGVIAIPPAPVRDVVDPTGAGDAYLAGLLTGVRAGCSLHIAGRLGSLVAAYVVEARGPQGHTFTIEDLRERYRQAFAEDLPRGALNSLTTTVGPSAGVQ
jgi:adenosine kinase